MAVVHPHSDVVRAKAHAHRDLGRACVLVGIRHYLGHTVAAETLTTLGVEVLVLDTTATTPTEVAKRIADAVPLPGGSVESHNRPDDLTVNS
ncbi:hypothetical protein ACFWG0_24475 [Streptomyces yangpuensis]|uniref:hypothetical protein n=1 Tax=Streptomyces yangpuensis TaxID=1648182 RepID=UPI0036479D6B